MKTHFRRLEKAASESNADAVTQEHRALVSRIDKAAQKGAIHSRNAARKKARAAKLAAGS